MESTSSASSRFPLLFQSIRLNENPQTTRSELLKTFFHYEHSVHPRCHVFLCIVIIVTSLSLIWLIGGLTHLRQTASYSESCAAQKVRCASGTNLVCSLASSLCICPDQMFWDSKMQKCRSVKTINSTCSTSDQCDSSKGLICYTNGICQCPQNTYYASIGCIPYVLHGASCQTSGSPLCNVNMGLTCDTTNQTCVCPSSTYWSSTRCETRSTYANYCDRNTTCNIQAGLFCRLPGSNLPCDCPVQSKLYTCDCEQGKTWLSTNGSSLCVSQGTFYSNCTYDTQCPQVLKLACVDGVCDCSRPFWFWSMNSSKCVPCESVGHTLIRFSSQWVCTQLISSSLMTFATSNAACTAQGWSLISPILALDISVIAQAYPTYRVWVNIVTSIGSSVYVNNLFPNNQSNWNSFVMSSLTADYSSYSYALQIIPSYNETRLFEGNTNLDMGHALCAIY